MTLNSVLIFSVNYLCMFGNCIVFFMINGHVPELYFGRMIYDLLSFCLKNRAKGDVTDYSIYDDPWLRYAAKTQSRSAGV